MNIPKPYVVSGSQIEEVLNKYEEKASQIISEGIKNGNFLRVKDISIIPSHEYKFNLIFFVEEDEMAAMKLQMEQTIGDAGTLTKQMICPHEMGKNSKCLHCGMQM